MASFVNRGTKHRPSWQYTISRYVDGKYKPIRKGGFRTKSEAQAEAEEIERKLKRGETIFLEEVSLVEYFRNWFKLYKKDVSEGTLNHYEYTAKYIEDYFGDKAIQKITRNDYQLFLNVNGEKFSKEVMKKVNSHIRSAVQDAVEDGIIRIDFTRKARVTGIEGKNKKEKFLNYNESKLLYNELFKRLDRGISYYALLLLLVSGIRFEELVGLTRKDFDFTNNTINIDKIWGHRKSFPEGFSETKTPSSVRKIGIDPKVMAAFNEWFTKRPDNINRLVFFSPTSKYRVISNTSVNNALKRTLKDLNIEKIITVHELRHTHASSLIYKKATIPYISERLGHSSHEMTYRRYSHVIDELKEEDQNIAMNIYNV